jgi:MFS family permease
MPGLALGVLGLVFFIPSIWVEWFEIEAVGKAMGIIGVLSFSLAQACLLSFAPLQRRHAWVFYAAVALILALAAIISGIIISEPHGGDWIVRVVGVVAILDGCFSLCVPILHRLGGREATEKTTQTYNQIELACPRCGERGIYATGNISCPQCSLCLRVDIGGEGQ